MASPQKSSLPPWSKPFTTIWRARIPKDHFTIGIQDDVSHSSLTYDSRILR